MKKVIAVLVVLGFATLLQARTIKCDLPVTKCEPVWEVVVKKIAKKECWDEEQNSTIDSNGTIPAMNRSAEVIVSKKCTVTKCKTIYKTYEEKILVGYRNYAKYNCGVISKISNKKLKFITVTIDF